VPLPPITGSGIPLRWLVNCPPLRSRPPVAVPLSRRTLMAAGSGRDRANLIRSGAAPTHARVGHGLRNVVPGQEE
jgi:hypothetical protein